MTIKCHLTGELPITGGKVRIDIPCKSGVRGLANASQEVINLYTKYPLLNAKLHVSKKDELVATGSLQEGPKTKSKDGSSVYDVFVRTGSKTYVLVDFLANCDKRIAVTA